MKRLLMIMITVLALSACTMPSTKIYSLSIPVEKDAASAKSGASVNILIHSPRYLSQSYIAYRVSPYQLEISRYSKWDSTPNEMVKEALKDSLSATGIFNEVRTSNFTVSGFYTVDVNLKRFERSDNGSDSFAELAFDVVLISPEGRELYRNSVSKRSKLDERGFLSLARVLSSVLPEGLAEVKAGMIKAIPSGT